MCVSPAIRIPSEGLINLLQLIPANGSGLTVARWHVSSHSDDLDVEIFEEALVGVGLLEAIVFSVVLLRSGRSLGVDPAGTLNHMMSLQMRHLLR
jgi:hypothetical protein